MSVNIMIFWIINRYSDLKIALLVGVLYLILIVGSLSLHEFGHAYIAYKNGDPTAKLNGRMTVNPMAHLDLIGMLMLVLIGFGFAKPVPVNMGNFQKRRNLFFVAVAGVSINLILAIIFSFLCILCYRFAPPSGMSAAEIFGDVFFLGTLLNLALIVFNLLPIFPLDGFRVVESFASYRNKFVEFMRKYGTFILLGLIVWGVVIQRICEYYPSSAYILQYFDILGFVINFLANTVAGWLFRLWGLFL
ncbi:zinc metalloprotease [Clostridia bacterium]|nr:zinc metalloprotease [Clostridia bacterium]